MTSAGKARRNLTTIARVRQGGGGFGRGWRLCLIAIAAALFNGLAPQTAFAETRSLKLYFIHTKERAEIVYKRDGRYDQSGLARINRFLRDWRHNESTRIDPRLLDLVWSVYRSVGARDYIHVVSAYRSPATNNMLRRRSSGVAQKSQHMLGKAMDFYIPGVPLSKLRAAAFKAEGGGVGYYPKSGAPFVHVDVGNVRSWPRMSRHELLALFPDGKTVHLPADGKPLPGYEQAMAAYKARRRGGGEIAVANVSGASRGPRRGLLAALFGGGADEEEDAGEAISATPAKRPVPTASAKAEGGAAPTPDVIVAALPEHAIPLPAAAPRPRVAVGSVRETSPAMLALAQPPATAHEAADEFVALNVPLPTPRPEYRLPVTDVPLPSSASARIASAGVEALDEKMIPAAHESGSVGHSVEIAALVPDSAGGLGPALMESGHTEGTNTARDALRNSLTSAEEVRTRGKTRRPTSADAQPDPKSRHFAVSQNVVQWALSNEAELVNAAGIGAPSFVAQNLVRAAPRIVYTAGFEPADRGPDASRFSGKAVKFLPVARFASN